jgi:hypothetical protein
MEGNVNIDYKQLYENLKIRLDEERQRYENLKAQQDFFFKHEMLKTINNRVEERLREYFQNQSEKRHVINESEEEDGLL